MQTMESLWKSFFGFAEDRTDETFDEAVARAKGLLEKRNYEDAWRVLRYAEKQNHAEAMYLSAWCYWHGHGVREDAGRAIMLWKRSAAMGFGPAQERCDSLREARERMQQDTKAPEQ